MGDDLYDLVEEPKPRPAPRPATTARAKPVEPIEYQHPSTRAPSELDAYFPDRVKDLYLPLALIGGGTVVHVVYTLFFERVGRQGLGAVMRSIGVDVVVVTGLMLVAVFIAAKLRHINLGPLPVAVLKLCAVVLGGGGITILLTPLLVFIPFLGVLLALAIPIVAYFTLLGALFDLDESDTWYCLCVMFLVWLAAYFGVGLL